MVLWPMKNAVPTFMELDDQNVLAMKTGILYDEATIRMIASTTNIGEVLRGETSQDFYCVIHRWSVPGCGGSRESN